MSISIAIPTYNRADDLRATLKSLLRVNSTGIQFEVMVIDNNSSDHTPQVVEEMLPSFQGQLRGIREEKQGLNHARNRAVAEAQFEIVAFLDDDVELDPNWLQSLAAAYQGDYAAVGGKAYLIYPKAKPGWLGESCEGLLSKVDRGQLPRLAEADELYGLNLSIKKCWIEKVGLFRPDLDRVGSCLISGGETDLLERISQAGGLLFYEPAAIVGHRVPLSRLRRRWFWSRCYWGQRGEARRVSEKDITTYELCRRTWWLIRACGIAGFTAITHGPASAKSFDRSNDVVSRLGFCVGFLSRYWNRRYENGGLTLQPTAT